MGFPDASWVIEEVNSKINEMANTVVLPNDTNIIHTFVSAQTTAQVLAEFTATINGTVRMFVRARGASASVHSLIVMSTSETGFAEAYTLLSFGNTAEEKTVDITIKKGVKYKISRILDGSSTGGYTEYLNIRGAVSIVDPSLILTV